MKTQSLYIIVGLLLLLAGACKKHDFAEGTLSPIIAVSDMRSLYKGSDLTLTKDNMKGANQIVGIVISNPDSGNAPKNLVILQNNRRQAIRGIAIPLGTAAANYRLGDSLLINVEGAVLKRVNGTLQLTGITESGIKKVSSQNPVTLQGVSSYTIKNNPDAYESTLVQIKSATISPAPKFTDIFAGNRYLVNGADSILMHTEATATYATAQLPASATVAGILYLAPDANGKPALQVWPRTGADITGKTAPVDPNAGNLGVSPVVITGYTTDVKGSDGNYEYFQFRAARTIDFSKTPMAVVTCTNAGTAAPNAGDAPGGGWATGGGRTYKFNLTSGIVNKGDFFYVGGSGKKINGANTADISSAKWIRSIAYVTNDGDGFGSMTSGLLPNSGNAGGIAIFLGTSITATSVPLDVVIYGGTGKTTIYNATTNKGYLTAENDHYHIVDPSSGTAQPFIYQGTNTYVIPHSMPADAGIFVKLGGVFDATSRTWSTPRGYTFFTMPATAALTDIESGSDVTVVK